ncbi:MAG TPA: extracellular solute-binding protein, partial [Chloroflexota bacterium]|nr:extracellular solute-binding protein [Chloroflexota bacterium]
NVGGLVRCDDNQSIFSGEYVMTVLNCGSYQVRRDRAKGAPIAHVIPPDAATIGFFYMGVPRTASHPNLAKLFINMLLTEEGQRQIYALEYTDHYALPGSQSAVELADLRAAGSEPLKVNVAFITQHPELKDVGKQLADILRQAKG